MRIRIIGSMSFYDDFVALRTQLEGMGHATYIPVKFHGEGNIQEHRREAIERFRNELEISDCILVVNNKKGSIESYIGVGAGIEIGLALGKGKKIYMLKEPVGEVADYYSAIGYTAINGDLRKITN